MKSPSYLYLITRVHGLMTHLLMDDVINSMAKAWSFDAFIDILSRTEYGSLLSKIPKGELTIESIERLFAEVYSGRIYYPVIFARGNIKEFLINYARKLEVENIKRVIRAKFCETEIKYEELIPIPRGYEEINFSAMIAAPDIDSALEYVTVSIYRDAPKYLSISKECNSIIPLELYIENKYYEHLAKVCMSMPEANEILNSISIESDIKNIYYIIGFKLLNLPTDILSSAISSIKVGRLIDFFNEYYRAKIDIFIEKLTDTPYDWIINSIKEPLSKGQLEYMRVECKKALRSYYKRIATAKPLSIQLMLAYLSFAEDEYHNLRTIAYGKYLRVKDEIISKLIVL